MLNMHEFESAKKVFAFFAEISKIPHGSGNTDKIAEYLVDFARSRALYVRRDEANNVIIRKPATKGYENRPTVIFQGHTDMVCAQSADSKKNMLTEGLDIYRDGDFLKAEGTTLGGDDGVAIAYALAILDSEDIPHPEFEAIFTSDEETGLIGAQALKTDDIRGKIMINIDSDSEGIFIAGCAGGARVDLKVPMRVTKTEKKCYCLALSGLKGGHSGAEINKGRANAIKLLFEALSLISKSADTEIAAAAGGNADNAIPRSAKCILRTDLPANEITTICASIEAKYKSIEPDLTFSLADKAIEEVYDKESSANLISLINEEPSGVIAMSEDIRTLVETSLNMGIIECEGDFARITFSVRSSKSTKKNELITRVTKIAQNHGAAYSVHGEYPGWEYRKDSHLRDVMCKVYERMYGKSAKVIAIHAGLECGIFSDKIEGLDCISIGPDNFDIHTTEERLSISSTARVWDFLKEVLKSI